MAVLIDGIDVEALAAEFALKAYDGLGVDEMAKLLQVVPSWNNDTAGTTMATAADLLRTIAENPDDYIGLNETDRDYIDVCTRLAGELPPAALVRVQLIFAKTPTTKPIYIPRWQAIGLQRVPEPIDCKRALDPDHWDEMGKVITFASGAGNLMRAAAKAGAPIQVDAVMADGKTVKVDVHPIGGADLKGAK